MQIINVCSKLLFYEPNHGCNIYIRKHPSQLTQINRKNLPTCGFIKAFLEYVMTRRMSWTTWWRVTSLRKITSELFFWTGSENRTVWTSRFARMTPCVDRHACVIQQHWYQLPLDRLNDYNARLTENNQFNCILENFEIVMLKRVRFLTIFDHELTVSTVFK